MLKGGEGYIQRRELKTHIFISVKVFHGKKQNHVFKVSILDRIQVIMDRLRRIDQAEMQQYYNTRLVYPMGFLRNLSQSLDDTF